MDQTSAALDVWVTGLSATLQDVYATEEMGDPHLALALGPGEGEGCALVGLGIGDREVVASLVRTLVAATDPPRAAFCAESWRARLQPGDPRIPALRAHELQVSALPPEDRIEQLVILAEDRAGAHCYRFWTILPGSPRRFVPVPLDDLDGAQVKSRYLPLYTFRAGMGPPYNLSEADARRAAQEGATSVLKALGIPVPGVAPQRGQPTVWSTRYADTLPN